MKTSENIQKAYDEQYDDRMTKWRELGGKYKAQNIIKVANGRTFNKVLDFGAGEGSIMKFLDDNEMFKELYAVEISDSAILQLKKRNLKKLKEIQKFDGYQTSYQDDEFDLVYCSHVIEPVEFPRLVLREIRRISKFQVFEIPLDYSMNVDSQVKHFLSYGHINIFTPSLFKFLLKSEGFKVNDECFTETAKEVVKYNWYVNMGVKKTLKKELFYSIRERLHSMKKMVYGEAKANEYMYRAYTCFTIKDGDSLSIFNK
jgi:ubiquinone/menaquinone biosynthesis C-methylase UbiE